MNEKTILIVEDEPVVGFAMRETLEKNGYHVPAVIGSGDEVISSVLKYKPHLILMDIRLNSFLDGVDAVRRLKMISQVPVIFISAYSQSEDKERALRLNPAAYLSKPVKDEELCHHVRMALVSQN